eukprot:1195812-Prorocentrum_minimum.AAC.4
MFTIASSTCQCILLLSSITTCGHYLREPVHLLHAGGERHDGAVRITTFGHYPPVRITTFGHYLREPVHLLHAGGERHDASVLHDPDARPPRDLHPLHGVPPHDVLRRRLLHLRTPDTQ